MKKLCSLLITKMAAPMEDELELLETDNYYSWLGLSKEASTDEVNQAFRRLSRIYHPDKHAQNQDLSTKAEHMFTQIKKAHDVLSDPQRRAIYDTMGLKGLETEGWEVVTRTKTPQEILEEYERLEREREERRLEQSTNPKGTIVVGVDATDMFDSYEALEGMDYRTSLPHVEINQMTISQSVECPLTTKDTAVLSGNLGTHNGNGAGSISGSYRRVTSAKGWAEAEVTAGQGAGFSLKGFRTLWKRGFGTLAGTLQITPRGLRPGLNGMLATQLDKNLQGRMVCSKVGRHSSLNTSIIYDNTYNHLSISIQLGLPSTFASLSYSRKFPDSEAKIRGAVKAGTFGAILEYGCEKKISKFSTVGASMHIGVPIGITLKIKLFRGNQTFMFPFHLADDIVPQAVFYGTVAPLVAYFIIKVLLVNPFLKAEKEKDLQRKRDANAQRIAEKKRNAEAAVDLMKETVDRSYEAEEKKGGLVIKKALYGKLEGDDVKEHESINVTRAMQSLVKDSKLFLPEGTQLSELPGFYDPCIGEEKELVIMYEFRRKLHQAQYAESKKVLIPHRDHLCDNNHHSNSSSPPT